MHNSGGYDPFVGDIGHVVHLVLSFVNCIFMHVGGFNFCMCVCMCFNFVL